MPASRRARAITFAPRSWPSRPGFAISTRIGFSGIRPNSFASSMGARGTSDALLTANKITRLAANQAAERAVSDGRSLAGRESGDGGFFVDAEHFAEAIADFAERGVGFDGCVDVRHEVGLSRGGGAE